MTTAELVSRFRASKSGSEWTARCPGHDDRKPSLSIKEGDDGRTLLYCHYGCEPAEILKAVGLEMRDMFTDETSSRARIVAAYPYRDESGSNLLYEVVRFEPKDFRQRRPGPNGEGWTWNLNGTRRVLYNLPEVLAAKSVLICEGEKDCGSSSLRPYCDMQPWRSREVATRVLGISQGETGLHRRGCGCPGTGSRQGRCTVSNRHCRMRTARRSATASEGPNRVG